MQTGLLVGAVLDGGGGRVQQLPGQIGECAGGGELRPDPCHLPVGGITSRLAVAGHLVATRHDQASLDAGLPIGLSNGDGNQPCW